jgi:hypothetical protein
MSFLFGAPRAVAAALGVCASQSEIDQDAAMEEMEAANEAVSLIAVAKPVQYQSCGIVPAYQRVIDPAVDKKILEGLFGNYVELQHQMTCVCPDCDHTVVQDYQEIDGDTWVRCEECECEEEFRDFFQHEASVHVTSRTPTDDEVHWVTNHPWRHPSDLKKELLTYYLMLIGIDKEALSEEELESDHRFDGYDEDRESVMKSCDGCQDPDDGCQCRAEKWRYYGEMRSLEDKPSEVD